MHQTLCGSGLLQFLSERERLNIGADRWQQFLVEIEVEPDTAVDPFVCAAVTVVGSAHPAPRSEVTGSVDDGNRQLEIPAVAADVFQRGTPLSIALDGTQFLDEAFRECPI